jgi:hypothetical protein
VEKGCKRMNMVQILCTHACKWKNETIPGIREREAKGKWEGVNLSMIYLINFKNFCK